MKYNFLYYVGLICLIPIPLVFVSLLFSLFYREWGAVPVFIAVLAIQASIGMFCILKARRAKEVNQRKVILIPILGLLITIFIGSLPYIFLSNLDLLSAFFEAASGFVTCGATIFGFSGFDQVEMLPNSLLFWRSATEWIGGFGLWGILVLVGDKSSSKLAQKWGFRRDSDMQTLGKHVIFTYTGLTLVSAILLTSLGKMTPFDALNHGMTSLATGGFSTKNAGLVYYNLPNYNFDVILIIISATSLLGMSSFVWQSGLFIRWQWEELKLGKLYFIDRQEFILMLKILIPTVLLLFIYYLGPKDYVLGMSFRQSITYSITSFSGTGFNFTDLSEWDATTAWILLPLAIVGGSAYSASGGLSLSTLGTFLTVVKKKLSQRRVNINIETHGAFLITSIFLIVIVIGTLILFHYHNQPIWKVVFQIAAAQSNTGPQLLDFTLIPPIAKLFYLFIMVGGYFKYSILVSLIQEIKNTT